MSVTIDGYPIDIALSIDYSRKSDISSYPVERGTNFTDTVRVNEPELSFEGLVSDTPVGSIAEHPTRAGVASVGASAFQRLDSIQVAGLPVTVECSLGIFTQMEISSLKINRDSKTRKGLKFTVTFSKIRIVDNAKTTITVATTGDNDFGLSLTLLRKGDKILWRKGKPPGSSNIVGKEVLKIVTTDTGRSQIQHLDGRPLGTEGHGEVIGGPLTHKDAELAEQEAFFLDLERDAKLQPPITRFGRNGQPDTIVLPSHINDPVDTVPKWVQRGNQAPPRHTPLTSLFGK